MKNRRITSVLIIEDDEIDATLITERLSAKGVYTIHRANSLREAQELVTGDISPDAILLDLTLPDSNGIDTFFAIHKKTPHIPIVILTGVDDDAIVLQTLQNGAQDYLIKGNVNNQLLERTIRYAIERKQFEEDLIKSKVQLDEAMAVAQLYQWEFDTRERSFVFNEKLWDLLGSPDQHAGTYKISVEEFIDKFVYAKDKLLFEEQISNARQATDPDYASQVEFRIVRLDGQVRHLMGRIRVKFGNDSRIIKYFGILQDITERKIALEQSYEALNQVDSAKTEFLHFISQEIRTPLNGVVSAVNLIKNQENSSAVRSLVETLDKSVSNLESFTNNAILYTKLNNNYNPDFSEFKIKDIIQFALLEKEDLMNEKEIRIKLEAGKDNLLVRGDKDLVYKLFVNIIDVFVNNSSKLGAINIQISDNEEAVTCLISDKGNIFSESILKSYSSVAGIYQNCQMGLSMYIIKLIIDKHKGEFLISNESGDTATAKFVFPR